MDSPERVTQFYIECHHIVTEATFIIHSLPNAEIPAVERIVHQLDAIRQILAHINDPLSEPAEIETLVGIVEDRLRPLEDFLANLPPPPNAHIPRQPANGRGHPAYVLDTNHIFNLHRFGNSWSDIAAVFGVDHKTLYNHLRAAGFENTRRSYTDIEFTASDYPMRS